jgi:hypothetical protein
LFSVRQFRRAFALRVEFRASAPRAIGAAQVRGEAPPLLVARHLELLARVAMLPPGSPLGRAFLRRAFQLERHALFFRRVPQLAAREPLHHGVGMLGLQLLQGRQQLLLRVRAESGRLPFENDRPVGVARRHRRLRTSMNAWMVA